MKDLLTLVKEANNFVKEKYPQSDKKLFTTEQLQDIQKIYKEFYQKQSFWWKIQNSFLSYTQMIILDLQYNFIGGGVLNQNGNTEIEIR